MDRLPPEILLEIFANLEYFDLRRAKRVCKSFRTLLKKGSFLSSGPIELALFRSNPIDENLPEDLKLHPILSLIRCHYSDDIEDILVDEKWKLMDLRARDENATSPAIYDAFVYPANECYDPYEADGSGKNGAVKVKDLIETLCNLVKYQPEDGKKRQRIQGFSVKVYDEVTNIFDKSKWQSGSQADSDEEEEDDGEEPQPAPAASVGSISDSDFDLIGD